MTLLLELLILFCVVVFTCILWSYLNNAHKREQEERERKRRMEEERLEIEKERQWRMKEERLEREHQRRMEEKRLNEERQREEEWNKKLEERTEELERERKKKSLLESLGIHLTSWLTGGSKDVKILLCGKTGVGKSSLVNALIGQNKAAEGDSLNPETTEVNDYEYCLNDIKITLFDTPGLADRTGKEEEYLRKIRVKVTGPCDVFIFCAEMNATRFRDDDIKTLKTLTKAFGPRLWEHALVALTFANNVHPPKKAGVTEIGYFDGRIQMFKKAIKDVILEAGVSEKVMTNIPFVATGHLSELSLPGITDWIEVFWIETFKSLNKSAKLPFFVSNFERVKFSSSSAKQPQDPSRIHLTIESVKILLEAIKGFLPQSVQNMINFLIKWCGHTAALTAIMELIKDIWPKGTSKEDAKDNDEDAKEEENMADEYGVVEDMDQE